ncbi:MAG: hypothetical protein QOE65_3098 [Solirubrobacteraceae bacterium]|jgi:hypothetical protein|nr:hypothetical protein [Solirubrobacteraceae bacterium]
MSSQEAHARADASPRRTVTITGHPDKVVPRHLRLVEVERRRPPRTAVERLGPRPDRIAMWAVFMALFLIAVVLLSS